MIEPYTAVALQTPHHNCQTREDWEKNLDTICEAMDAAIWLASLQFPVKLVALGEAAIQTFTDSRLGFDHATAANEWFNEFPGPELDRLRKKAQEHRTFVVGQCRNRDPQLHPDRYFNIAFIIDPEGEIIHRYHKNQVYEEPIYPKNLWMDQPPQARPSRDQHLEQSIRRLQERGTYTPPAHGRGRDDRGADVPGGTKSAPVSKANRRRR